MKMHDDVWVNLTREQQGALREVFCRRDLGENFTTFLNRAYLDGLMGCVMVPWCGMWLGIEPDGHTHS